MRAKRIDQVETYILENKSVSIDKLCETFDISKNTVRRDLDVLTKKGTVAKVYGGAISTEPNGSNYKPLTSFNERNIKNSEAKIKIVKQASKFVNEGDTIFIDTGTSTLGIIDYLGHLNKLTIITNSIELIYKAQAYANITIIGLPGILKRDTSSLVGSVCFKQLKTYNIDKAFMACTAISLKGGVTNASFEEYEIKKTALEVSHEHYLLVDHSKFDKTSLMTYSTVDQFDCIITDTKPNKDYIEYFNNKNIHLEIAEK